MSNIHVLSPAPSTIAESEVTTERLCSILSAAVIENEIQESGEIYITDGVGPPLWISRERRRKLLCFITYYPPDDFEESVPVEKILTIVNLINIEHVLVQFYWHRDQLWGAYWMTYDKRLDPRHFIKMLRRYSEAFEGGVERFQDLARVSNREPR